jgi:uncharacterized membrane protein YhhN
MHGRLIAAVTLVPAVAAALVLWIPWPGSFAAALFGGWIATVVGCIALLGSQNYARHFGKAAFVSSVVYAGLIILVLSISLSSVAGSEDF